MSETSIEHTITELAAPLAASLGLDIWGVDVAFGRRGLVRVFVESETGVNIDKCAELSRLLGLTLDVEDVLPDAYVLEVSSPGLERIFFSSEQLAKYVGKTVEVTLHTPATNYPDRKRFMGELTKAENGEFSVMPFDALSGSAHRSEPGSEPGSEKDASNDIPLPASFTWEDIKKAKLVHFLPEPEGTVKGRKIKQKTVAEKQSGEKKTGE